ncbi:helix-turn-helix transcriptional regulator [Butyrivibrio sp. NC3005]|uniref:helix-turn-helix transcriptional regulator n=1 Tax=Butyrivibrio sp. NC3005 TaxID=1280685 RepID=UPI00047878AF|nr:helix-turn-helix transcriptional regulator [Butyrivibrio sp. NC3005]
MSVINHLREIRTGKGLTQKEVADALSISKDSLSRYETGKQDPRLDVAIRLSKYLEVSMEILYDVAAD